MQFVCSNTKVEQNYEILSRLKVAINRGEPHLQINLEIDFSGIILIFA